MVLTICEMWKALDELTIQVHPILSDYCPLIPLDLFEPLVLPRDPQMKRLHAFEGYLQARYNNSIPAMPSLLASPVTRNSFSVRIFNSSSEMQQTRFEIESYAERIKQEKITELEGKVAQLEKWDSEIRGEPCGCYYTPGRRGRFICCWRCRTIAEMSKVKINKFEWPLPNSDLDCKAAVFELRLPAAYQSWRDTTYLMLTDFLQSAPEAPKGERFYSFKDYSMLNDYIRRTGDLSWGSKEKPIAASHYDSPMTVALYTRESDVCFPHALRYQLYDVLGGTGTHQNLPQECSIRALVTPPIPSGRYTGLENWVKNVTHTQNAVISEQSRCPHDLDILEFIAFGSFRAGERIQWANVLLELEQSNLTYSAIEVHILVSHASSQCGTRLSESHLREAHQDLSDDNFCLELLAIVEKRLRAIEDNWQQRYCLLILGHISKRVLSVAGTRSDRIRSRCFVLIKDMIQIGHSWLQKLLEDAKELVDAGLLKLQGLALETALIARLCFDVDAHHVPELLSDIEGLAYIVHFPLSHI